MIFTYANYYFNFGFNVTCITNKYNFFNRIDRTLLKSPSHEWSKFQKERQAINTLRSYNWEQAVGLGVVLGYNRLRALDIDDCEDFTLIQDFLDILNLPSNYKWVTQSGSKKGFHILFYSDSHKFYVLENKIKAFKSNSNFNKSFKHIELRWIGHLVLPPSLHPSAMNYQFLNGIPLEAPFEIKLEQLYTLLKKYCSGNSLKEEEEVRKSMDNSGVYIQQDKEKDEEAEELMDDSGVYIQQDKERDEEAEELMDDSGVYIQQYKEKDEEAEESMDDSGVYIEEDKKEDEDAEELMDDSGVYIQQDKEEDEEAEESMGDSGVYIDNFKEPYYLFFDTETTGIPDDWNAPISNFANWPRLVQLAWLLYDSKGKLISKNEKVIKPAGFSIPRDASDVHDITTDYALKYGTDIEEVLLNFEVQCSKSKYLIAHNINFDSKVMGSEFLRTFYRNPISKLELLCTMESSTSFCKIEGVYGYKWPKLSELHIKLFGVDFAGTHNALADTEATARCFWKLRKLKLI